MAHFAVEYRTPTGRIATVRVEAASTDEAIDAAVTATGCDFADIQTTERRDGGAAEAHARLKRTEAGLANDPL